MPTSDRRFADGWGWSVELPAILQLLDLAEKGSLTWMPPAADARCHYLADWVSTKIRWSLTIDTQERDALNAKSEGCTNTVTPDPA